MPTERAETRRDAYLHVDEEARIAQARKAELAEMAVARDTSRDRCLALNMAGDIAAAVSLLEDRINNLADRLGAVLTPEQEATGGADVPGTPPQLVSPLTNDLIATYRRVTRIADQLDGLTNRLEV